MDDMTVGVLGGFAIGLCVGLAEKWYNILTAQKEKIERKNEQIRTVTKKALKE
jgi:hypothetical protein